jgi:hypothetical protein
VTVLGSCSSGGGSDGEPRSEPTGAETTRPTVSDAVRARVIAQADRAGKGRVAAIDVPAPTKERQLAGSFSDDARALVRLTVELAPLASEVPTRATCERVARRLERLGGPDDLVASGAALADGPTAELAQNLVTAATDAVATCGTAESADATRRLAFAWALWDKRLDEVLR